MKVLNKKEVNANDIILYKDGRWVLSSGFRAKEVFVKQIIVINDNLKDDQSATRTLSNYVVGTMLGGPIGFLGAALESQAVDIDIDIYLEDGRVIETKIDNQKDLRAINELIKSDPRDKYRKERGAK